MEWTEDLSVGVAKIDEQHKELFRRINSLVDAIKSKTCKYKISDVIRFLEDYIIEHFSEEEGFMTRHGYPDYAAHKALHEEFMQSFAELKVGLEEIEGGKKPGSYDLSVETNQIVVDWILNHIARVDKRLGVFLKDRV